MNGRGTASRPLMSIRGITTGLYCHCEFDHPVFRNVVNTDLQSRRTNVVNGGRFWDPDSATVDECRIVLRS
jgi:hypothetical protein